MTNPSALCKLYVMPRDSELVTQTQAAEILGVDDSTVSRWSDERLDPEHRKLTVVQRFGYTKAFRRADVEALRDELAAKETS